MVGAVFFFGFRLSADFWVNEAFSSRPSFHTKHLPEVTFTNKRDGGEHFPAVGNMSADIFIDFIDYWSLLAGGVALFGQAGLQLRQSVQDIFRRNRHI